MPDKKPETEDEAAASRAAKSEPIAEEADSIANDPIGEDISSEQFGADD
jgi:hypothetical protein